MSTTPTVLKLSPEDFMALLKECDDVGVFGQAEGPMITGVRAWRQRMGLAPYEMIQIKVVRPDGRPLYPDPPENEA